MNRPCPICAKPMQARYRPFCSRRCADVDLRRWFSESYSLAGPPEEPAEESPEEGRPAGQGGGRPV